MSEKLCAKCNSAGPFVPTPNGTRCQACGNIAPESAATTYTQPDIPPKPLAGKMSGKNPLGA